MAVRVEVPSSKSYTQRALILAALARGTSTLEGHLDCDDSRVLIQALRQMGVATSWDGERLLVHGGELVPPSGTLFLGNAGTAVRFVSGLALVLEGRLEIDGESAMRRRPMPGLIQALRSLGVTITELGRPACPPLQFDGPGEGASDVTIDPSGSSQQVSSLLMVGARLPTGLKVHLSATPPSRPYIDMTLDAMSAFGCTCRWADDLTLIVGEGLSPARYRIEADYSAAAMVLAGGWIAGREVRVHGLDPSSLQGDRVFVNVLNELSRPGPRTLDLRDAPDVVPPTVAAALFSRGETRIEGIGHLRIKECDRVGVLATELAKIGARIQHDADSMTIRPGPLGSRARLDPHRDHRMAMAFGLVSLRIPDLEISDRGCISKSFPDFWSVLERLR